MEAAEELDIAVIGGGIVGLAVARALAQAGNEVVLLEAEPAFGAHTSSRNSEVIHAGIYYPTGSLKATLCLEGKHALYAYCERSEIPHRRIGKIIVASDAAQRTVLEGLHAQAAANGVNDLEWLDKQQIRELEPEVIAELGLLSPSTGIIDSHEFMLQLRRDAEAAGALVVPSSPVLSGSVGDRGIYLAVGGADPTRLHCRAVVNAGGLFAPQVARSIEGLPLETVPTAYLAKGHYFTLSGSNPFRRLVYPVPAPGGLGIHVTLDMAGAARFGPDVSWVDTVDYSFDESRAAAFYRAIRAYYPGLSDGALVPGYTGIRPKIVPPNSPAADFVLQGPEVHGLPLVNLYGIESPGLTAALAVGTRVVELLQPTVLSARAH